MSSLDEVNTPVVGSSPSRDVYSAISSNQELKNCAWRRTCLGDRPVMPAAMDWVCAVEMGSGKGLADDSCEKENFLCPAVCVFDFGTGAEESDVLRDSRFIESLSNNKRQTASQPHTHHKVQHTTRPLIAELINSRIHPFIALAAGKSQADTTREVQRDIYTSFIDSDSVQYPTGSVHFPFRSGSSSTSTSTSRGGLSLSLCGTAACVESHKSLTRLAARCSAQLLASVGELNQQDEWRLFRTLLDSLLLLPTSAHVTGASERITKVVKDIEEWRDRLSCADLEKEIET